MREPITRTELVAADNRDKTPIAEGITSASTDDCVVITSVSAVDAVLRIFLPRLAGLACVIDFRVSAL